MRKDDQGIDSYCWPADAETPTQRITSIFLCVPYMLVYIIAVIVFVIVIGIIAMIAFVLSLPLALWHWITTGKNYYVDGGDDDE